jgi:S-adenosylmethionine decarboxylase
MGKPKEWGQSVAIDLFNCQKKRLTDPKLIRSFIIQLTKKIKMKRHGETLIDRFGSGDLEGYSAMQFVETSSITLHLDEFRLRAFVDIFSCKRFNSKEAEKFTKEFFRAKTAKSRSHLRG